MDVKEAVVELRGGYPEQCDYCKQIRTPEELIPDEGGTWSCTHCWQRWAMEGDDGLNDQEASKGS